MNTIYNHRNSASYSNLWRVGLFLLLAVLLAKPAMADVSVEGTQRMLQGRYYYLTGQYLRWPGCPCGNSPAPHFPPEKFYGDLSRNREFGAQLVRDLWSQFQSAGIVQVFFNTPDGITGIEGTTDGNSRYFNGDLRE